VETHEVYIDNDIDMEGGEVGGIEEDIEPIGDASFSSIASTIKRAKDRKQITDFAISVWGYMARHKDGDKDENLTFDDENEGIAESKVQESISVICEVK
jgi:hypothetical protein